MSPKLRANLQHGVKLKREDWVEIGDVIFEKYKDKYTDPYVIVLLTSY